MGVGGPVVASLVLWWKYRVGTLGCSYLSVVAVASLLKAELPAAFVALTR
jgi:hypothetical protein